MARTVRHAKLLSSFLLYIFTDFGRYRPRKRGRFERPPSPPRSSSLLSFLFGWLRYCVQRLRFRHQFSYHKICRDLRTLTTSTCIQTKERFALHARLTLRSKELLMDGNVPTSGSGKTRRKRTLRSFPHIGCSNVRKRYVRHAIFFCVLSWGGLQKILLYR